MKTNWILLWLLVCLVPLAAFGALTKTTSIDTVDDWQSVTAGTLVVGTAESLTTSYQSVLYIELAPIEAVATDGANVLVEVSYADDDWTLLTEFAATAETCATTTTDGAVTDANTVIDLTDSSTGDFDVVGRKWFIKDGTIANSESVRTQSDDGSNAVTLCSGIQRSHNSGVSVYDRVDEWVVTIPFAAAYVRVIVNNDDADCDCAFTTRISKVTALE